MQTDIDVLVLESFLVEKAAQPLPTAADSWSQPLVD
jgi:hypothetical protein